MILLQVGAHGTMIYTSTITHGLDFRASETETRRDPKKLFRLRPLWGRFHLSKPAVRSYRLLSDYFNVDAGVLRITFQQLKVQSGLEQGELCTENVRLHDSAILIKGHLKELPQRRTLVENSTLTQIWVWRCYCRTETNVIRLYPCNLSRLSTPGCH